jgi:hypothetical protein
MAYMFYFIKPDGSRSAAFTIEKAATHSVSPKSGGVLHTRSSIQTHILSDLVRNSTPFPFKYVAVSGYFMDPICGGGHVKAPEGYVKEAFLHHVVSCEAGVVLQDCVTKGEGSAARTSLLLVDSVQAPFAPFSKSRKNATAWGIPVMSYAQYLATYYCLRVDAAAAPATP